MNRLIPMAGGVAAAVALAQSSGHPFDAARVTPGIDSFALVMQITGAQPVGYVVQTVARDGRQVRIAVDYDVRGTRQRIEMVMDSATLFPMAHWENVNASGREARGEVRFNNARATGAYIRAKSLIDVPVDSGVIDEDAGTALLPTLPLEKEGPYVFRTFGAPGEVTTTRVYREGIDTVVVPAGRFEAHRLRVVARDTSHVFVTTRAPRRLVLVRLANGSGEMRLIGRR